MFKLFWSLFNLVIELSKMVILAPSPAADLAANSATVPAPRITTFVDITPEIPPSNIPFPPLILLKHSLAIKTEVLPAISLMLLTIEFLPSLSFKYSNDRAVIFFLFIESKKDFL